MQKRSFEGLSRKYIRFFSDPFQCLLANPDQIMHDVAEMALYIKYNSIQRPVYYEKIIQQLVAARAKKDSVVLFSPWGPPYRRQKAVIRDQDAEIGTLREITETVEAFEKNQFPVLFLLMPADSYGININGLEKALVMDYFGYLEERVQKGIGKEKTTVVPWSSIKTKNKTQYKKLKQSIERDFYQWVKYGQYKNAVRTARFFGKGSPEKTAKRYCVERLVEGILIDELYSPIKISLAEKGNDIFDGPLSRVYLIQDKRPWMFGEAQ